VQNHYVEQVIFVKFRIKIPSSLLH